MIDATKPNPAAEPQPDFMKERLTRIAAETEVLAEKHADAYAQSLPEPRTFQGVDATASNPEAVPTPAFRDTVLDTIAVKTAESNKKQQEAKFRAKFRAEHNGAEPTEEEVRRRS